MRPVERIPRLLAKLESAWRDNPDMRLGQLLINLMAVTGPALWSVEDEEIERGLDVWLRHRDWVSVWHGRRSDPEAEKQEQSRS